MSYDIRGGTDYALVKRHYDANDYTSLPFTATQTYYVVGTFAYLADATVFDINTGWCLFTHGQQTAPAYMLPFLATLGITTWPAALPSFEAKDILFYATEDCWLSFADSPRVQHFIPANTYMRFHQRCFMFFVQRDTADGTLQCWIEG